MAGHRILIVDDNQDGADSLAMLLEEVGHETHQAHDGIEAIGAAERVHPDAVLLDIGLPKLNGYEVCRRIREQPWGQGLTIVALTGWGQEEDRQRSQEAGFDTHLVKPVDLDALMRLLASLPSGGHGARPPAGPAPPPAAPVSN
jgi:CheY-like chemotaxis protein